ncbi:MAG: alpha/beta fold hydrolase [Hyphomicrobiaceae bacterium]
MTRTSLVLIPGLLCTADLFDAQISDLRDLAEVTIGDHTQSETMAGIARDILATAPREFALAGLSMGGYVAFEILRQAPQRVTRLALLDTSARPDLPEQTANRERLVELANKRGIEPAAEQLLAKLVAPSRRGDDAIVGKIIEMAKATGAEAFARQQKAIAARVDSRPLLAHISCPTLVLVGSDDELTPPSVAAEMASAIPGCRLEVVQGAGHLSPMEEPAAVTAALRFWLER